MKGEFHGQPEKNKTKKQKTKTDISTIFISSSFAGKILAYLGINTTLLQNAQSR